MSTSQENFISVCVALVVRGFVLLCLGFTSLVLYNEFSGKTCREMYGDAKYTFAGKCVVKFNGGYIPEELFKKQFIQNYGFEIKK